MDEILQSIVTRLMLFMFVTFLITEVVTRFLTAWFPDDMGRVIARRAQTLALIIGMVLALGWRLSILPETDKDTYQTAAYIFTGLIVGAGAVGWFEVLKQFLPWLSKGQREPADPAGD